ncbi:hypothetical protein QFZ26_000934 [Agromyces ramosus]|uniref:Uncharacterized protein n=1 Tax=Agromyces ramosus TaxID=33879 RepID=A0ABU0R8K2_9MICO|nr:hypothetical protein [Agromyces ramosus]
MELAGLELLEEGERRDRRALRVGEEVHVAVADELFGPCERIAHDEAHRRGAHRTFLPRRDVADRLHEPVEHALRDVLEPRDQEQRTEQREDRREDDPHEHEEHPRHDERGGADRDPHEVDDEDDPAGEEPELARQAEVMHEREPGQQHHGVAEQVERAGDGSPEERHRPAEDLCPRHRHERLRPACLEDRDLALDGLDRGIRGTRIATLREPHRGRHHRHGAGEVGVVDRHAVVLIGTDHPVAGEPVDALEDGLGPLEEDLAPVRVAHAVHHHECDVEGAGLGFGRRFGARLLGDQHGVLLRRWRARMRRPVRTLVRGGRAHQALAPERGARRRRAPYARMSRGTTR